MKMMSDMPRLGIVGIGRMGASVALNLRDAGYTIAIVYDAREDAAREFASATDCAVASSLAHVSKAADLIITVVSDDRAQERIFSTWGDSLLEHCSGRTFINCATLTPKVHAT